MSKSDPQHREKILMKTDHRCHICGGDLIGDDWIADHVLHHARGGPGGGHSLDNYLEAHSLCNTGGVVPRSFRGRMALPNILVGL